MNRSLLSKEQVRTIQRQVTVNFIGRNLVITLDAVLAASIHQHTGTDDICLEEDGKSVRFLLPSQRCEDCFRNLPVPVLSAVRGIY